MGYVLFELIYRFTKFQRLLKKGEAAPLGEFVLSGFSAQRGVSPANQINQRVGDLVDDDHALRYIIKGMFSHGFKGFLRKRFANSLKEYSRLKSVPDWSRIVTRRDCR